MQLFFVKNIDQDHFQLDDDSARHAIKVLRAKVGDELHFTNGNGLLVAAKIIDIGKKACTVQVVQRKEYAPRKNALTLAVAPTKNIARYEWLLEKATEIGVERIVPIICARSERKIIKPERLEKILISAMKQSQRAWLPELSEAIPLKTFLSYEDQKNGFIGWMDERDPKHLKDALLKDQGATVLIGPEGDFTPEEVEMAKASGYQPISLGPARLRTETAAIVACHTFALQQ